MKKVKTSLFFVATVFLAVLVSIPAAAQFGIQIGPLDVRVGDVIPRHHRRIELAPPPLRIYDAPPRPYGSDWVFIPGSWAWDYEHRSYYWIDGHWELPPEPGLVWTPGYWSWEDGVGYVWMDGYWDTVVGFYGGIYYGFGYNGSGYDLRWLHNPNAWRVRYRHLERSPSFHGGKGGIRAFRSHEQFERAKRSRERHYNRPAARSVMPRINQGTMQPAPVQVPSSPSLQNPPIRQKFTPPGHAKPTKHAVPPGHATPPPGHQKGPPSGKHKRVQGNDVAPVRPR